MKKLALTLLLLTPLLTSADLIGYEIPHEQTDVLVASGEYDHQSTYFKRITCQGRPVAVMYKMILGYSEGSRLLAVCALENATSAESCVADGSPLARACYDYTIAFYHVRRSRPMPSDFDRLSAPTGPAFVEQPGVAR